MTQASREAARTMAITKDPTKATAAGSRGTQQQSSITFDYSAATCPTATTDCKCHRDCHLHRHTPDRALWRLRNLKGEEPCDAAADQTDRSTNLAKAEQRVWWSQS